MILSVYYIYTHYIYIHIICMYIYICSADFTGSSHWGFHFCMWFMMTPMTPIQHRFRGRDQTKCTGSVESLEPRTATVWHFVFEKHLKTTQHLVKVLAHPKRTSKTHMSGLVQRFFWTTLAKDCKVRAKTHGGLSDLWNGARYWFHHVSPQ